MSIAVASLELQRRDDRRRRWQLTLGALLLTALGAWLVGAESAGGHGLTAAAIPVVVLLVPILVWRMPATGLVVLLGLGLLIEQYPIVGDGTDRIPLFTSLSDGLGLSGVYVNPAELILALFTVIWLLKAGAESWLAIPKSRIAAGLLLLMITVGIAEARGLGHGGQLKESLWELRPWLYLAVVYLLASQVIRSRRALSAVLWTFVLATGFKGAQGTLRYFQLRNVYPRPESILAHEDAFFFTLFTLLVMLLWIFGIKGRLRGWATALLPLVVVANLANNRRTAWLMLGMGIVVLLVTAWIRLPDRRVIVGRIAAGLAILSIVYLPLFWNSYGTIGQPARTVRSAIAPIERDRQSNQYRTLEDANLGLNIRRSSPFGQGFGVAIDYAIPIVDISNIDSLIKYVPHDGILYLWMRLGVPGILAFFWMIGAAFLLAGRVLRSPDRGLALWGSLILCAVVGYLVQGYNDMGLYWFRIAIFMGAFLGCLETASRLSRAAPASVPEPNR